MIYFAALKQVHDVELTNKQKKAYQKDANIQAPTNKELKKAAAATVSACLSAVKYTASSVYHYSMYAPDAGTVDTCKRTTFMHECARPIVSAYRAYSQERHCRF